MSGGPCILFMVRWPRPGRTKTRIAQALGDETAAALYRAFVEDMLEALDGCGAQVAVWVDPAEDTHRVRAWLGEGRKYLPQPEGDLGARMERAFQWAFCQGYGSAAALGSDLPHLTGKGAHQLVRLLRSEPALVGPSPDGGYWTIGFSAARYTPGAFRNMPWSTPELLARTMGVLEPLQPAILPELHDMDTAEDLRKLLEACPAGTARRTVEILKSLPGAL